jgi:hypothetical protein
VRTTLRKDGIRISVFCLRAGSTSASSALARSKGGHEHENDQSCGHHNSLSHEKEIRERKGDVNRSLSKREKENKFETWPPNIRLFGAHTKEGIQRNGDEVI